MSCAMSCHSDAAMFRPLITLFHGLSATVSSAGEDDALEGTAQTLPDQPTQQQLADPAVGPVSGITGLDVCSRKPVFVTCGADRTVRLWSYSTAGGLLPEQGGPTGPGARKGSVIGGGTGIGEEYLTPTLELVQVRVVLYVFFPISYIFMRILFLCMFRIFISRICSC